MNKIAITILTIGLIIISNQAIAYVSGSTNLGYGGYPEHDCYKPTKPYEFNSQFELDSYKNELETYLRCIEDYIDSANNDIKRIKEKADDAISEANSPY